MRKPTIGIILCISTLVAVGCAGDEPADPSGGGGSGAAPGDGGGGANQGGMGGEGAGGEGGEGGEGGMGGQGGTGGGEPTWQALCAEGCKKLNGTSCQLQSINTTCPSLNIACDTPPAEPLGCLIACMGEETTSCTDVDEWLTPAQFPAAPNPFMQCVATCGAPSPPPNSPIFGAVTCMAAGCQTAWNACDGDPTCKAWMNCTASPLCQGPDCFSACTQQHGANNPKLEALMACSCNIQPGTPVDAWLGQGDCADITAGVVDACTQLTIAQGL